MSSGVLGKTHEAIARHIDHRRTNQKSRKHSDLNVMTKMAAFGSYDLVTWTNESLRDSCDLEHLSDGRIYLLTALSAVQIDGSQWSTAA